MHGAPGLVGLGLRTGSTPSAVTVPSERQGLCPVWAQPWRSGFTCGPRPRGRSWRTGPPLAGQHRGSPSPGPHLGWPRSTSAPPPLVRDCVPARCALTGPWEHLRGRWRDWTSAILHCSLSDLCWLCRGVAGREGWWAQREVGGDGGGRCPCPVSRRRCRGPGLEPATLLPACPNLLRGPLLSPGPRHLPQPESVCGESQRSDCRLPVREWSGACGGVLSGDPGHGQQGEQGWELEPGPAHQDEAPPTPCRAAPPRPAPPRPARVPWAVLGSFFPCLSPLTLC